MTPEQLAKAQKMPREIEAKMTHSCVIGIALLLFMMPGAAHAEDCRKLPDGEVLGINVTEASKHRKLDGAVLWLNVEVEVSGGQPGDWAATAVRVAKELVAAANADGIRLRINDGRLEDQGVYIEFRDLGFVDYAPHWESMPTLVKAEWDVQMRTRPYTASELEGMAMYYKLEPRYTDDDGYPDERKIEAELKRQNAPDLPFGTHWGPVCLEPWMLHAHLPPGFETMIKTLAQAVLSSSKPLTAPR